MTFTLCQRVKTLVDAPSAWPGGFAAPAGSLGTIERIPKYDNTYGVLLDEDPHQIHATYGPDELEPA